MAGDSKKTRREFVCMQSGNCCKKLDGFNTTASGHDVRRWEKQQRHDILDWVCTVEVSRGRYEHQIWIHHEDEEEVDSCPFLIRLPGSRRHICGIHETKPSRCRNWQPPDEDFAREIGCKGYFIEVKE